MKVKIGDTVTLNPELLDAGEAVYGTVTVVDGDSIAFTDQSGAERTEPRWDLTSVDRIGLIQYVQFTTGVVSEDDVDWLVARVRKLEDDSRTLRRLEAAGVDNWEGYSHAFEDD